MSSEKPYPAFNSVLFILTEILGPEGVVALKLKEFFRKKNQISKPLIYFAEDIMLYTQVLRLRKNKKINVVMSFQGYYPITCIGSRLLGLKLLLYIGGSAFKSGYYEETSFVNEIFAYSNILIQKICHKLSSFIIVPSISLVNWLEIQKYSSKVRSAIAIIDPNFLRVFKKMKDYAQREMVVGYVGSFSRGKGVLNFLESVYLIVNMLKDKSPKFMLIGDGSLMGDLKEKIRNYGLLENVILTGYISHRDLPKYYNEMTLLILPSYTEGLPSVIIEAMACGTPVLATPVGAIPDIIKDGETGFLLKSNDPKHIANKIIELLSKPELLEKVSKNAYRYIRENFSYEKTMQAWQKILQQLEQA